MAHITLYVPDDVARRIRREARKAHKSVSACLTELAVRRLAPARWPEGFEDLYGSWVGAFPVPDDPPPEDVGRLSS